MGSSTRAAAARVSLMSGPASPNLASVTTTSSESTCSPGSARIIIEYANSTDDSFSPMPVTLSFARGVISRSSAMPCRMVWISSICRCRFLRKVSKKSNFCCTRRMATSSWRRRTRSTISLTRSMSPSHAASLQATRSLVTPASAETTTIGSRSRRSATMSIAFATRCASPTEVPPNLITIMMSYALRVARCASRPTSQLAPRYSQPSQHPLRLEQLRVQQRGACGTSDRVVDERDHPIVEDRIGTQPSHAHRHAALAVAVEARLRAVGRVDVVDRMRRRGGKTQLLRLAAKLAHGVNDLRAAGRLPQLHRHRHQMPVDGRHAVGLRGDADRRGNEALPVPPSE